MKKNHLLNEATGTRSSQSDFGSPAIPVVQDPCLHAVVPALCRSPENLSIRRAELLCFGTQA
jgi:hypothetical protein